MNQFVRKVHVADLGDDVMSEIVSRYNAGEAMQPIADALSTTAWRVEEALKRAREVGLSVLSKDDHTERNKQMWREIGKPNMGPRVQRPHEVVEFIYRGCSTRIRADTEGEAAALRDRMVAVEYSTGARRMRRSRYGKECPDKSNPGSAK